MNLIEDLKLNEEWMAQANCKDMDLDLFFPELGANYDPFVKEVCLACPVIEQCAWYANETSSESGMFGGMTPFERRTWRRKNKVILGQSRAEWEAA